MSSVHCTSPESTTGWGSVDGDGLMVVRHHRREVPTIYAAYGDARIHSGDDSHFVTDVCLPTDVWARISPKKGVQYGSTLAWVWEEFVSLRESDNPDRHALARRLRAARAGCHDHQNHRGSGAVLLLPPQEWDRYPVPSSSVAREQVTGAPATTRLAPADVSEVAGTSSFLISCAGMDPADMAIAAAALAFPGGGGVLGSRYRLSSYVIDALPVWHKHYILFVLDQAPHDLVSATDARSSGEELVRAEHVRRRAIERMYLDTAAPLRSGMLRSSLLWSMSIHAWSDFGFLLPAIDQKPEERIHEILDWARTASIKIYRKNA
ncbi:hypothetical protein GCM10007147_26910 [Nocardiopsis kunsanensis]|uniref:Uncharacterized protein n=2 Tax=Nocardiopsis kunsanensis TaxID=141693 RepID=A0A918XEZ5_9ACTN|nr:hypothetical protein GCM10007147_26910 [Nocardiopsis kunsanensis]